MMVSSVLPDVLLSLQRTASGEASSPLVSRVVTAGGLARPSGEILEAEVLRNRPVRSSEPQFALQIDGSVYPLVELPEDLTRELQAGQTLKLQVLTSGNITSLQILAVRDSKLNTSFAFSTTTSQNALSQLLAELNILPDDLGRLRDLLGDFARLSEFSSQITSQTTTNRVAPREIDRDREVVALLHRFASLNIDSSEEHAVSVQKLLAVFEFSQQSAENHIPLASFERQVSPNLLPLFERLPILLEELRGSGRTTLSTASLSVLPPIQAHAEAALTATAKLLSTIRAFSEAEVGRKHPSHNFPEFVSQQLSLLRGREGELLEFVEASKQGAEVSMLPIVSKALEQSLKEGLESERELKAFVKEFRRELQVFVSLDGNQKALSSLIGEKSKQLERFFEPQFQKTFSPAVLFLMDRLQKELQDFAKDQSFVNMTLGDSTHFSMKRPDGGTNGITRLLMALQEFPSGDTRQPSISAGQFEKFARLQLEGISGKERELQEILEATLQEEPAAGLLQLVKNIGNLLKGSDRTIEQSLLKDIVIFRDALGKSLSSSHGEAEIQRLLERFSDSLGRYLQKDNGGASPSQKDIVFRSASLLKQMVTSLLEPRQDPQAHLAKGESSIAQGSNLLSSSLENVWLQRIPSLLENLNCLEKKIDDAILVEKKLIETLGKLRESLPKSGGELRAQMLQSMSGGNVYSKGLEEILLELKALPGVGLVDTALLPSNSRAFEDVSKVYTRAAQLLISQLELVLEQSKDPVAWELIPKQSFYPQKEFEHLLSNKEFHGEKSRALLQSLPEISEKARKEFEAELREVLKSYPAVSDSLMSQSEAELALRSFAEEAQTALQDYQGGKLPQLVQQFLRNLEILETKNGRPFSQQIPKELLLFFAKLESAVALLLGEGAAEERGVSLARLDSPVRFQGVSFSNLDERSNFSNPSTKFQMAKNAVQDALPQAGDVRHSLSPESGAQLLQKSSFGQFPRGSFESATYSEKFAIRQLAQAAERMLAEGSARQGEHSQLTSFFEKAVKGSSGAFGQEYLSSRYLPEKADGQLQAQSATDFFSSRMFLERTQNSAVHARGSSPSLVDLLWALEAEKPEQLSPLEAQLFSLARSLLEEAVTDKGRSDRHNIAERRDEPAQMLEKFRSVLQEAVQRAPEAAVYNKALQDLRNIVRGQETLRQLNPFMQALQEPTFLLFPQLLQGMLSKLEITFYPQFVRTEPGRVQRDEPGSEESVESLEKSVERLGEERKRRKHGAKENRFQRVQFHLCLPSLGALEVDFQHSLTEAFLQISCESEEAKNFLTEQGEGLEEVFSHLGYERTSLQVEKIPKCQSVKPAWLDRLLSLEETIA